jgi:hypothetical protein
MVGPGNWPFTVRTVFWWQSLVTLVSLIWGKNVSLIAQ